MNKKIKQVVIPAVGVVFSLTTVVVSTLKVTVDSTVPVGVVELIDSVLVSTDEVELKTVAVFIGVSVINSDVVSDNLISFCMLYQILETLNGFSYS